MTPPDLQGAIEDALDYVIETSNQDVTRFKTTREAIADGGLVLVFVHGNPPAPAQTTAPKRRTEQDGGIPNDALTPDDPTQRGI